MKLLNSTVGKIRLRPNLTNFITGKLHLSTEAPKHWILINHVKSSAVKPSKVNNQSRYDRFTDSNVVEQSIFHVKLFPKIAVLQKNQFRFNQMKTMQSVVFHINSNLVVNMVQFFDWYQ